ncbi:hypothetical protein ACSFC1_03450 [Pseudothermotoga sp. U03pept]|uniref:hypothetical protein n=1 Tax=Pseudothermotoga sp. U03pept TaxID=3447012 RepID=UPI003EFC46A2
MGEKTLSINRKTFVSSTAILLSLMIFSGILTLLLPMGQFERKFVDGNEVLDLNSYVPLHSERLPIYRWFTAPLEVFLGPDGLRISMLILLLLIVGGTFYVLERAEVLKLVVHKIAGTFRQRRYSLIAILSLCFMVFGSVLGLFEEIVPLVPIVVELSLRLGWDEFVGLGLSILSAGFGFASATLNPFTVVLAQKLASVPLFSGLAFRLLVFAVIYIVLCVFLIAYAKRIDRNSARVEISDEQKLFDDRTKRSALFFVICVVGIFLLVIASLFIQNLQQFSVPLIALIYLITGLGCGLFAEMGWSETLKVFFKGVATISPSVLLILFAASVKHIITEGMVIDTILKYSVEGLKDVGAVQCAMLIYIVVLILNFFIPSASAKAFLLIPILVPFSQFTGLSRQTMILAWSFGDGFSNMIFPTNPVLLISLSLASMSYTRWFRKTIFLQLIVFAITVVFVVLAVLTKYGPF